jgi:lipid A 3-O-deacylase
MTSHPRFLTLLFCALSAPAPAWADDSGWALSVHFENDLFADTDQQYTNGIKITAVSPDLTSAFRDRPELPKWVRALIPHIPLIRAKGSTRTLAFSAGQNMYTPQDTVSSALVPSDRPYAGWLYFATTFQTRTDDRQDTFDVQLGVVGPYSFAEETQRLVHDARGIPVPRGWDNQLRTEPGLVLSYERTWRQTLAGDGSGFGSDLLPRIGAAVGNVTIHASAGIQMRAGWNLPPDFGYSVIRPGGVTQVNALRDRPDGGVLSRREKFTAYAFAGVDTRLVARDIFLDGNTFRDSHSVDSKPVVADFILGASLGYGGAKLSLARVFRTLEFHDQARDHRFGSVTFSYAF